MIRLDENSDSIKYLCKKDKRLAKVIKMVGPLEYEPHNNGYAFLIHEVIEQMLSIKVGRIIYARLEELCEGEVIPYRVALLSADELKSIGTSSAKVKYIQAITKAVMNGKLNLDDLSLMSDQDAYDMLVSITGIGSWTAKMYLMFVLNRQDVLPTEDAAFRQGFQWVYKKDKVSSAEMIEKCKKWRPYSSIAARYMYRALDLGLTKNEFHLYK